MAWQLGKNTQPECNEGEVKECLKGDCVGSTYCYNGKWGPCIIPHVCKPGSTVGCYVKGCGAGYKTCNECGSGYSECFVG
ncbi:MAG: hypothetical protein QW035_00235 [Candidatus Anstonellales archaeon]